TADRGACWTDRGAPPAGIALLGASDELADRRASPIRRRLDDADSDSPRAVRRPLPSGPHGLADEGQARRRTIAHWLVTVATAARPELSADVDRRPPPASAQAAAAA